MTPTSTTPTTPPAFSTHILRFMGGGSVRGQFCESTAAWSCEWTVPDKMSKKKRARMLLHYSNWRNTIFNEWSARTGKTIMVFDLR